MTGPRTSLDILVSGLFDYSGMFPPESKSFEDALCDSAQFRSSLVRPFLVNTDIVVQRKSLELFTQETLRGQGFQENQSIAVAYLGADVEHTLETAFEELEYARSWNVVRKDNAPSTSIVSFEIKISDAALQHQDIQSLIRESKALGIVLCLEPNLSTLHFEETLNQLIALLRNAPTASLKIRGTGPTGIQRGTMAKAIAAVADAGVHLKTTGGMHHPIVEPERYKNELGFLNFAAATVLRRVLKSDFSIEKIEECLKTRSSNLFSFEDTFSWQRYAVPMKDLLSIKKQFRMSVGSCSLKEPDQDLVRLFPEK